jgi:hypothetical protein
MEKKYYGTIVTLTIIIHCCILPSLYVYGDRSNNLNSSIVPIKSDNNNEQNRTNLANTSNVTVLWQNVDSFTILDHTSKSFSHTINFLSTSNDNGKTFSNPINIDKKLDTGMFKISNFQIAISENSV